MTLKDGYAAMNNWSPLCTRVHPLFPVWMWMPSSSSGVGCVTKVQLEGRAGEGGLRLPRAAGHGESRTCSVSPRRAPSRLRGRERERVTTPHSDEKVANRQGYGTHLEGRQKMVLERWLAPSSAPTPGFNAVKNSRITSRSASEPCHAGTKASPTGVCHVGGPASCTFHLTTSPTRPRQAKPSRRSRLGFSLSLEGGPRLSMSLAWQILESKPAYVCV